MIKYIVNLAFESFGSYKKGQCSLTNKHIEYMNHWGMKDKHIDSVEPFLIQFPFNEDEKSKNTYIYKTRKSESI